MTRQRAEAIEAYLRASFPSGYLPMGALKHTGLAFGVSGERVRQIAQRAGMRTATRTRRAPPMVHRCPCCSTEVRRPNHYCARCRLVTLRCSQCGGTFQRPRRQVQPGGGAKEPEGNFYCSRRCFGRMVGKRFGFGSPERATRPVELEAGARR